MVIPAKGNEITGCDSTELDGQCGWLLKRGLIIFQSSQFILKKKKNLLRLILNVSLLQFSSVISSALNYEIYEITFCS